MATPRARGFHLVLFALLGGVSTFAWGAGKEATAPQRALSYVECSTGLEPPRFEGGDTEFEMEDVNLDGHVDLVSVGDHGNPRINADEEGIMVWLGDGRGSWSYRHAGYLGYGGVALGDLDWDGLIDIAYGVHHDYGSLDLGDQKLEAALGDGSGFGWTPWDDGLATHGQDWGMFSTDFADVEADGDLDIGSSSFGSGDGLHTYLNRMDGTWARSFGFLGYNSGQVFGFGDVDGDGVPDIGTAKQEGTVWLGDGEGFFTKADGNLPPIGEWDFRAGVALGDVDGDGRDDLASCNASDNPEVWLWRGANTWEPASAGLPTDAKCERTQLWDMDGDGRIDLVVFGLGRIRVFGGDGGGTTWTLLSDFNTPDTPGSAAAFRVGGDVDHNGYPDLVLVNERNTGPFSYINKVHAYRESSTAAALAVRVVRPGPDRRLVTGSVAFVDWAAAVPAGQVATATIEVSTSGPLGPWQELAAGRPNNGRYQWLVPAWTCTDCRLRVTVGTGSSSASAIGPSFSIARRREPLALSLPDRATLHWQDALSRDRYQIYRGDWQHFLAAGEYTQDPSEVPAAARFCGLTGTSLADPFVPSPGQMVFYLATAIRVVDDDQDPGTPNVPMAESPLGQRSDARMRANVHPCPP